MHSREGGSAIGLCVWHRGTLRILGYFIFLFALYGSSAPVRRRALGCRAGVV